MTPLAKILWLAVAAGFVFVVIWLMEKCDKFKDSEAKEEFNLHVDHLKRVNPKGGGL